MPVGITFSEYLTIEGVLTVSELINKLQKMDPDKPVLVFADGNLYPCLALQKYEEIVEIGCGWLSVDFDEMEIVKTKRIKGAYHGKNK